MGRLDSGSPAPGRAAGGEVRPFALGQEALRPPTRLAGLERIGERLARRLRGVIEPFARAKPSVVPEIIETLRFDAWRDALPGFTSLSLYRMRPLKGGMLIAIAPDFVTRLVDVFYGGNGLTAANSRAKEFTAAEERLISRLTDAIVEMLVEVWAEVLPLTPALAARETNASYASLVRGDELVVVQRFGVVAGHLPPTTLALVYPLSALRPYEAQLSAKVHAEPGIVDGEFRERMANALANVKLPVRSVLARPTLTVSELLDLKVGDVIPITLAPRVPLIVANRRLAEGTIGEQEGRAALRIEEIGAGDNGGGG
jgi:flagellar motor switch protein FliM